MLTNEQVAGLQIAFERLAEPVTEYIIKDVARRVSEAGQFTSSAAYQIWRAQQLGMSRDEIEKAVADILKKTVHEVRELFKQAAEVGYNFDIDHLTREAIPFEENASVQQIVDAAVKLAEEDFRNITQTLGFQTPDGSVHPMLEAYQRTTDFAFQQVITGATDYNTAIRQACTKLASGGVKYIDYASGVHTTLEAAIRRNMMGGLGLMVEEISQRNHDELGADGWELSAHANSAPDHEPIQGKQYTDAEYQALNNSLIRRIGTLNCGHNAFPIIIGVNEPQYTPEQLEKFREENEQGVTVDGKHYTGYEATQMQRKIERSIRAQKRRVMLAGSDDLPAAKTRLTRLRQEYSRFSKAAGLRTEDERLHVSGFGRKQKVSKTTADQIIQNAHYAYPEGVTMSAIGDKLNNTDINAINQYKSARSYLINSMLRGEMPMTEDCRAIIHDIDQALLKLPEYEGTVYRSLRSEDMVDTDAFWKRYTPGTLVFEHSYTSASVEIYDETMDVQMIIHSKHGRDMREWNRLEQEILFRRGSMFYVERQEGNTIWLVEV